MQIYTGKPRVDPDFSLEAMLLDGIRRFLLDAPAVHLVAVVAAVLVALLVARIPTAHATEDVAKRWRYVGIVLGLAIAVGAITVAHSLQASVTAGVVRWLEARPQLIWKAYSVTSRPACWVLFGAFLALYLFVVVRCRARLGALARGTVSWVTAKFSAMHRRI